MNQQLMAMIQQNRMPEARSLCASLCKQQPSNAQLHFIMSAICGQLGDYRTSEQYCQKSIKLAPDVPETYYNLGIARLNLGKHEAAAKSFRKALSLRENFPEAWNELGNALQKAGETAPARDAHGKAVQLRPGFADAWHNLAIAQKALDAPDDAINSLKSAIAANPGFTAAYIALAELLKVSDPAACSSYCELAIKTISDDADTSIMHGLALLCRETGRHTQAIEYYRKAISRRPKDALLHTNLGVAQKEAGRLEEAISSHRLSIQYDPGIAEAHYNLGSALYALNRLAEAESAYLRAVELKPAFPEALTNLGTLQLLQGRAEDALTNLDEAQKQAPDYLLAASNRLLAMNYRSDLSPEEIRNAHVAWGKRFENDTNRTSTTHLRPREDTRLRIGFVSPDFRNHSVAYFFQSLLPHNDSDIQVYCYSNTRRQDEITDHIRSLADLWVDITRLSDAQAADLIRDHRIDILIDLAGHTSDHRLGIFALRPCLTQVTCIGYPNTTGLESMDYRVTDRFADPDTNDAYYTEDLIRLDPCFLCYCPPADSPEPAPFPSARSGRITFGSFNNLAKLTPDVARVWSRILHAVPDSVLMLKNRALTDSGVARRIVDIFSKHDIAADRILLEPWSPETGEHLASYGKIDIALDTFPYNGTTTTCEALWMGRPVITLMGQTHASRVGHSLLNALEMNDLTACDAEEYVRIASDLAENFADFTDRYGSMRARMLKSPLCDRQMYRNNFYSMMKAIA